VSGCLAGPVAVDRFAGSIPGPPTTARERIRILLGLKMAKSDPPLISVCLPVYNTERYVGQAIESILNQTLGDFELLILDDGSTDGSLEVLRRYADRDPRIHLTSRPNKGLAPSLNELVDQSRGEFLARMDADDVALPERFERQVEYLRAHPDCVLVGSRVRLIDPDGDPLCDWCKLQDHESLDAIFLRGERSTEISHPAIIMRRDAVLAVGKYRPFEVIEDVDLFLRLAERGRIANLPEVLLQYRIHASNISKAKSYHQAIDRVWPEITRDARRRRNLPELADPPAAPVPPRTDQTPVEEREKWAWWALGAGHLVTARKHAHWVLSRAPLSPRSWKLMYCVMRGH
jgi:GT2 family glycosyltransferase